MGSPGVGDVAAWLHTGGGQGHVGITAGGGAVIYAGPSRVKINTVNQTTKQLGSNVTFGAYRKHKP